MNHHLKNCPFCRNELVKQGANFHHTDNECWLSRAKVRPCEQAAWNRRAPAPTSELGARVLTGQMIYDAVYKAEGGQWLAVDDRYKPLWEKKAVELNALLAIPPAASEPGARELLQEFVDYHSKSAGMTLEIALDVNELGDFLAGVEAKEKAMVKRAVAFLANTASPAVPAQRPISARVTAEMWEALDKANEQVSDAAEKREARASRLGLGGTVPSPAPVARPLDLSAITSVVKRDRGENERAVVIRFRSAAAVERFLAEFGDILTGAAASPLVEEAPDTAMLNWLEAWREQGVKAGFKWDSLAFNMEQPVREQIAVRMARNPDAGEMAGAAQRIVAGKVEEACSCPSGDGSLGWPCPQHQPELDEVVEANRELLYKRSQLGIKKYGGTLAAMQHSHRALMQHLLEELLDAANYIQADIQASDKGATGKAQGAAE